jgi:hypothetical protein
VEKLRERTKNRRDWTLETILAILIRLGPEDLGPAGPDAEIVVRHVASYRESLGLLKRIVTSCDEKREKPLSLPLLLFVEAEVVHFLSYLDPALTQAQREELLKQKIALDQRALDEGYGKPDEVLAVLSEHYRTHVNDHARALALGEKAVAAADDRIARSAEDAAALARDRPPGHPLVRVDMRREDPGLQTRRALIAALVMLDRLDDAVAAADRFREKGGTGWRVIKAMALYARGKPGDAVEAERLCDEDTKVNLDLNSGDTGNALAEVAELLTTKGRKAEAEVIQRKADILRGFPHPK